MTSIDEFIQVRSIEPTRGERLDREHIILRDTIEIKP